MVVSEGDRSLIAPRTKSRRCTACADNLFAGKEAGGGVVMMLTKVKALVQLQSVVVARGDARRVGACFCWAN